MEQKDIIQNMTTVLKKVKSDYTFVNRSIRLNHEFNMTFSKIHVLLVSQKNAERNFSQTIP